MNNSTNNTTHADLFGTTTTPCPNWCTLEAGHGYDSTDAGSEIRIHERGFGDICRGGRIAASVVLVAAENVTMGDNGVVTAVEPAQIELASDGNELTSDQAREVAALLLEAARKLDEVAAS